LTKYFGRNIVLNSVDLEIRAGEVHGLLGENGSGKSTLIKILGGYHSPEPGATVEAFGKPLSFPVSDARSLGIAIVHQDLGLVDSMTVLENFGITSGYGAGVLAPVRWRKFGLLAEEALDSVGVKAGLNTRIDALSPADRTLVAIARARFEISTQVNAERVLFVLDEPTALLSFEQSASLLESLRSLTARGDGVLLVTHKLPEMLGHTDRVSVLRDGVVIGTRDSNVSSRRELVDMMLGRSLLEFYGEKAPAPASDAPLAFRAHGIGGATFEDVSFSVRAGEIVGFTGVAGSGFEELPSALTGVSERSGSVLMGEIEVRSARGAVLAGLVSVPGDRRKRGVWLRGTIRENITIAGLSRFARVLAWLNPRVDYKRANDAMGRFDVRPMRSELFVDALSGGNQQKVVLAKVMLADPAAIVLEEPTQGVDAGARKQILEQISAAASRGVGACIVSADFEQLSAVCHRIFVFRDGKVADVVQGAAITENAIWEAVYGGSISE
jgi:ribose transport system ATP-binding protein